MGKADCTQIHTCLQYECTSPVLAPVGCLQYYMAASGIVESFNYKEEVSYIGFIISAKEFGTILFRTDGLTR